MGLPFLKNFKISDFQCHCPECAKNDDRPFTKVEVLRSLQIVRDLYGKPMRVARGLSCASHNAAIGGAGDSRHLPEHADAVDVAHNGSDEAYEIVNAFMIEGDFTTLRVYPHHVHADMRPGPHRFIASPE